MSETRQPRGRKGSNTAKKTGRKKSDSSKKAVATSYKKNSIWAEVRLVVLLVASLFLLVSNFGAGGWMGNMCSFVLFGCLGIFAYLFPLFVLFLVLFSLANKENLFVTVKMIGAVIGCVTVSALLHILTVPREIDTWLSIYLHCAREKTGGGLLGGMLAKLLLDAFGSIGAYLVLVGVLIICLVIVTERSFVRGMSKGSKRVYESARQDVERIREQVEVRRVERKDQKELRKDKKVSGVTFNLKIPKEDESFIEMEDELEEEIKPENAKVPSFSEIGTLYTKEEEELPKKEAEEEISFSEEDLLRNALSRREFEKERISERKIVSVEEGKKELEEKRNQVPDSRIKEYQYPPVTLLKAPKRGGRKKDAAAHLQETAQHLQQIMEDFGVHAFVTDASQGPSVTRFEVQPAQGVKVSKIVALADDIKLNLAVPDIRIEAPIPGKAAVGIEVPNKDNSVVAFRELLESEEFKKHPSPIAFGVGKDIGGQCMVTDIAKMPHLLIAGATGSGKSVCINTLIMSILYKARPEEVKLIMVDPKVVELSVYNGIPHLLIPVVTDPKKAAGALNWAVTEMMGRYNKFAEMNVRNIEGYNEKIDALGDIEGEDKPEKMPKIVIIVDELADLMMVAAGEVEDAICRLAQLARAAGIHLIIATQRPSVNVITGLIKANMPSRIAFAVSSSVDSRTILDMGGAEKLLGKGDMLIAPYGAPKPLRVQGAFVSDSEVGAVVQFLSEQKCQAAISEEKQAEKTRQIEAAVESASILGSTDTSDRDVLFAEAGKFIIEKDKASIGMLQRWFKVGFNRAARIMDQLAEAGVVGEEEGTKPRKVLMSMEEFEQYLSEYV